MPLAATHTDTRTHAANTRAT